jgi:hypothetical protein
MRSLVEKSTSQKTSTQTFLWFTLGIMILSSVGYAFLSSPTDTSNLPAEGSSTPTGVQALGKGIWGATIYGAPMQFYTDPLAVANISVVLSYTLNDLGGTTVEYDLASGGLSEALGMTLGQLLQTQPVCLGACKEDVPERTCATPVIRWDRNASFDRVWMEENCTIISGSRAAFDAWIYRLTGFA